MTERDNNLPTNEEDKGNAVLVIGLEDNKIDVLLLDTAHVPITS